jgi:hypothetical protein
MPELAIRLGRKAGDLEREQAERAEVLDDLVKRGSLDVPTLRATVAARGVVSRRVH